MENLNPETIDLIRQNQDLLNRRLKHWIAKEKSEGVPELSEFMNHAETVYQKLGKDPKPYQYAIETKYNQWIDNNWKDGNNKSIKNWRSKLSNTIPYLRPVYPDRQFNPERPQGKRKEPVRIGDSFDSHQRTVEDTQFTFIE